MGNTENQHQVTAGVKQYIAQQFNRVRRDTTRNHITLTEIIQAKHPQDYPFDFRHIGILYVCDHDMDGVFSLRDFQMFALWVQINMQSIQMYEFQAQLQAKTVAKMIEDVEKQKGEGYLIGWFLNMLLQSHRRKKIEGQYYIIIDGIKTLYEVLNVQLMTDMDIQSFFYLVKNSSQQIGYKIEEVVQQDQEQQYISMRVCQQFVKFFFKGILKILKDIGYSSHLM